MSIERSPPDLARERAFAAEQAQVLNMLARYADALALEVERVRRVIHSEKVATK